MTRAEENRGNNMSMIEALEDKREFTEKDFIDFVSILNHKDFSTLLVTTILNTIGGKHPLSNPAERKCNNQPVNITACNSYHPLKAGTPVYCDLLGGIAQHTGICLGNKIVHLDGDGDVIFTTPKVFLARLDGRNQASNIYYAATDENKPLANSKIAARAKALIGTHPGYDIFSHNCHDFCIKCITGRQVSSSLFLKQVEDAISDAFNTQNWHWCNWGNFK